MTKHDIKAMAFLLKRFAFRYSKVSALLLIVSIVAGLATAMQPMVLSPALNIFDASNTAPASSFSELNLNNLGPSIMSFMGITDSTNLKLILFVCIAYCLFSAIVASLTFVGYLLAMWVRSSLARDMAYDMLAHLFSLPMAYFNRQRSGDLISRFVKDSEGTAYFLDSVSRGIIQSLVTVAICIVLLCKTDMRLAAATLAVGLLHVVITRLLSQHIRDNTAGQNVVFGEMSAVLQEVFLGIRIIKSFVAEPFQLKRFREVAENVRKQIMRFVFFKHFEEPLRLVANALAISVILFLSFRSYQEGRIGAAGLGMFLVLAQRVIEPISMLCTHLLALSGMLGCSARLLEIFNTQSDMQDGKERLAVFDKDLIIENVSYTYDGKISALIEVSLTVKKGELVALVGPSGGGKSTLADIILRLYDPTIGVVKMDGVDVRKYLQSTYRAIFGVVPQECMLMNGSIKENVVFGRTFNSDKLARALQLANAEEFVEAMPDKVETQVGDRGVKLSGGQRQRIAIARAVYDEPAILLLDEATSALDSDSERQVQEAIEGVLKGMTGIVIAHRLSTIRKANRIIVMDSGKIQAIGTHGELLKKSPLYSQLCKLQFGSQF